MEANRPFTLQKVDLLHVTFQREELFAASEPIANHLQISITRRTELPALYVTLEAELFQSQGENQVAEVKVRMGGEFLVAESVDPTFLDNFADINAPAIIFPFVRETIASLTLRAGIPTALLQPISFVDLAQQRQQQLSQSEE